MRLPGYATPEGTLSYLRRSEEGQRTAAGHFRQVLDELYLSSLGMGSYLGQPDPVTDTLVTEAVLESVDSGAVNVLDTAINYRFMLAERAIGKALRMLLEVRGIPRDELFICSKNGFLTPDADSPLDFRSYFTQRYIDSGLITADDIAGGMHGPGLPERSAQPEPGKPSAPDAGSDVPAQRGGIPDSSRWARRVYEAPATGVCILRASP
jgi:hypothetical protein